MNDCPICAKATARLRAQLGGQPYLPPEDRETEVVETEVVETEEVPA